MCWPNAKSDPRVNRPLCPKTFNSLALQKRRHDTQHNGIQYNDRGSLKLTNICVDYAEYRYAKCRSAQKDKK